jgi:hypothetical protein
MKGFWTLLAAAGSAGVAQWELARLELPELGNLTASAILGWFAWHTAAKTIPDLVAEFRAEMAVARADYRSHAEAFRAELAAWRAELHADHVATAHALGELGRTLRE